MNKITSIQDTVTLNNGVEMPWFGLGVFRAQEGGEVEQAIQWATDCGYRSIDTAAVYGNEAGVGKGVRACGVDRDDLFITTKLWNRDHGYDNTLRAFDESLQKLRLDYVDLYLIHWPVPGKFKDSWRAFERILREERARAIGVSNFMQHHLEDLLAEAEIVPAVNQIEFHPYLVQPELLGYCREKTIQVEAWSPLMKGRIFEREEVKKMAERYGKTTAQIVLRWDLEHQVVTIPKSVNKDRIAANADIFDFALSAEDVAALDQLDRGERVGPDPDNFSF